MIIIKWFKNEFTLKYFSTNNYFPPVEIAVPSMEVGFMSSELATDIESFYFHNSNK